jgi:hypothetical protein
MGWRLCCEISVAVHYLDEFSLKSWDIIRGMGHWRKVPMFARIDTPQILFLAASSILIVGIAYLF